MFMLACRGWRGRATCRRFAAVLPDPPATSLSPLRPRMAKSKNHTAANQSAKAHK